MKFFFPLPSALALLTSLVLSTATANADPIDFAHDVLPLLNTQCAKCHTNGTYKGGLSMDSRAKLIESGAVVVGKSGDSELIDRIQSDDPDLRMPKSAGPDEPAAKLKAEDVATLARWIDEGLKWEEGFSFKAKTYKARLAPRRPELPPAVEDRNHPVDRIVDAYFAKPKRNARIGLTMHDFSAESPSTSPVNYPVPNYWPHSSPTRVETNATGWCSCC